MSSSGLASSTMKSALLPAATDPIASSFRIAAEFLKMDAGTVASGKSADFIVLDANPLDDINNTRKIATVYLRGKQVNRPGLRAKWSATRTTE